jgi:flagellar biogenesis protein FliO
MQWRSMSWQKVFGMSMVVSAGAWLMCPYACWAETLDPTRAVAASFAAQGESSLASSSARMIGGLFLCLGVFAFGVRMFKKYTSGPQVASRRRIEVRERVQLSSKSSLLLVAVDNREFLVARGSETVQIVPNQSGAAELFAESLDGVSNENEAFNA